MSGSPTNIVDSTGQRMSLGPTIGQGAEGAVYELLKRPEVVAKIYHNQLSKERTEKIRVMAQLRSKELLEFAAWPLELLSRSDSGQPIGFLMPRVIDRKDIHNLYSPKSRRSEFERADWRFLLRAATNTARALAMIHKNNCIVGDINHGSVLVSPKDATVKLVDCDSFQVMHNSKTFRCEYGVETFTPPELQGRNFKEVQRNQNHDNFGLAVLIFLLLFMGRHPFAGRFLGSGEMPIPKAIQENRFAYGSRRASIQMERPPHTPDLSIVGDDVAFLFERAFAKEMIPGGRPDPVDWIRGLTKLESSSRECSINHSHWFAALNKQCPWCLMEAATGAQLFPFVIRTDGRDFGDISSLWRQIEAIPHPGPLPNLSTTTPEPSHVARKIGASTKTATFWGTLVAVGIAGYGLFGPLKAPAPLFFLIAAFASYYFIRKALDKSDEIKAFQQTYDTASAQWKQAELVWTNRASASSYDSKKSELSALKSEFDKLAQVRLSRLEQLKRDQKRIQLERFLDRYRIEDATIEGIGKARKQTLESYGIETAADLLTNQVDQVPGIGPKLRSSLMVWRNALERQFVFDSRKAIDPRDISKIEQDIVLRRANIQQRLRTGIGELQQIKSQIINARQHLRTQVTQANRNFLQAKADLQATRGQI